MSEERAKIPRRRGDLVEGPEPGSTRERILNAAERLFAEQGYGNVSMPAIAAAAGITAGAIYKHFESKDELFFHVVHRAVHASQAAPAAGEPNRDLPRLIARYTTERLKRGRQLAVEMHYASAKHPKIRRLLRRSLEHDIAQIARDIAAAQAEGRIDPTVDPMLQASAVMAFLMGLMHMETLLPERIGDKAWHDYVAAHVATLLGMQAENSLQK